MQEDEENANRANELHQEKVEMEQADVAQCVIVGELVAHNLMRHEPADKDAGEEAHDRQEHLTSDKVEEVEHRHLEELVVTPGAQR